jgi:hypothetical protein
LLATRAALALASIPISFLVYLPDSLEFYSVMFLF